MSNKSHATTPELQWKELDRESLRNVRSRQESSKGISGIKI